MKKTTLRYAGGLALLLLAAPAVAETQFKIGGDTFASGLNANLNETADRDALMSGMSVTLTGQVAKDAHLMGLDVTSDGAVGGDLYATGFSVSVEKPVTDDLTAAGLNVRVRNEASIGGNARLTGGNVIIDGPVSGSLLAAAGTLTVNGSIGQDARLTAGKLIFGPDAKIAGELTYSASEPMEIAANVISPDRVHYEKTDWGNSLPMMRDRMDFDAMHIWPSFFGVVAGFIVALAFLAGIGAIVLNISPVFVDRLQQRTMVSPLRSLGLGTLGLGALIGLVPISIMSFIGIPLVPVIALAIVSLWIGGYLLGVYAISIRALQAFRPSLPEFPPGIMSNFITLVIGLVVFATLNFIPFFGWLINLLVVLLGIGGIAGLTLDRFQAGTVHLPPATTKPPPEELPPGTA